MKKTIIADSAIGSPSWPWLDLEKLASVELTSEDPNFPIERALAKDNGLGWRAAQPGRQIIRVIFHHPTPVHRIRLEFHETEVARTQEFALRWSQTDGPWREIVRQQWNFSPQGSSNEVEDYAVDLDRVSILELTLTPALGPNSAVASLGALRVA